MKSEQTQKPLFVPLKTAYFEGFKNRTKTTEYRPFGPRWNERTCRVGREVVLSKGYGKAHRLKGRIVGFRTSQEPTQTKAWRDCYGDLIALAACIEIEIPQGDPQ
jgi:hypothetical protein